MPLIIEGGAYNLCWCGPPARTWNIAPGPWNHVERQWLVWQGIGVAQVIKNGVLMGSSSYESLMFTQVYYIRSDSCFGTRHQTCTLGMYGSEFMHSTQLCACMAYVLISHFFSLWPPDTKVPKLRPCIEDPRKPA